LKTVRHILGLVLGFGLNGVIIPFSIYHVNIFCDKLLGFETFGTDAIRTPLGILFLSVGLFFVFWANTLLIFRGKGGPFNYHRLVTISPTTKKLVTTGPYRYTRNPMAFGAFTAYISIPIFIGSISGIILFFFFLFLAYLYFKKIEEKRLLEHFGEEFEEYRNRVSLIFPLPPRKAKTD
jgi:protein-S-isoprenylcysteine O-methyltransferase Ste14